MVRLSHTGCPRRKSQVRGFVFTCITKLVIYSDCMHARLSGLEAAFWGGVIMVRLSHMGSPRHNSQGWCCVFACIAKLVIYSDCMYARLNGLEAAF